MTILGKILTFVVLVLSLLWTFLTVSAYAARTNWQAQAIRYQKDAKAAADAANAMKALYDQAQETSDDRARVMKADLDRYASTTKLIQDDRDALLKQYNDLLDSTKKQAAEAQPLIGRAEKLIAEVGIKDDQIRQKDAELNALKLSEQAAVVKAGEQTNVAKAQTERADRLADKVQRLEESMETIRRAGVTTGRTGVTEVRVPAPPGFRASVVAAQTIGSDLYVTINQGLDAGLQKNTELTLSRLTGDGTYLGKLVITNANPKDAIGRFVPPPGTRLTSSVLPKAGDTATGSN